jgi:hypothetical protein
MSEPSLIVNCEALPDLVNPKRQPPCIARTIYAQMSERSR